MLDILIGGWWTEGLSDCVRIIAQLPSRDALARRPGGRRTILARLSPRGLTEQETHSIAKVMAAAPELLRALQGMDLVCTVDHLNPCWDNRVTDKPGLHWGSEPGSPIKACAACTARAAIAKAIGPFLQTNPAIHSAASPEAE